MTCLGIRSLPWYSLALIIRLRSIERESRAIDANTIVIVWVELLLLHLLDTGTHLSSNNLPRKLLAYNGRLLSTVNNSSSVWATPKSMETAFFHITNSLYFFKFPICSRLFIVLVWCIVFLDGFESWKVEVDRIAVDWYACIGSDMDEVISLIVITAGIYILRIIYWKLSIWCHLTWHYKLLMSIHLVRNHAFKLYYKIWGDIIYALKCIVTRFIAMSFR